ncbi:MAG: phosphatidylglycerophosphatase A [Bacteroidota bacterium]
MKSDKNISFIEKLFATGFFTGYFPIAPGTFASLLATIIFYFFFSNNLILSLVVILFFLLIGIWLANKFDNFYGDDPSIVTIDEFVGMWISLLLLPINFKIYFLAFIIFRIFDIVKLWPASYFDRKRSGKAIMFDDIVAGIFTNISIRFLIYIFPTLK